MSSPAIIHKARFVKSTSKTFRSYIEYIDRDEATRNYKFEDFSLYNDYMNNPDKSGSLFTCDKNYLSSDEKDRLKKQFTKAQSNGSLMWQDVFSFDNEWLKEKGFYDDKTHILDEAKIRTAIRTTMGFALEKDNLTSAVWSASVHYNTDNIHVHVATVELNNPRDRGKRTKKTLGTMKSKFINEIYDRSEEYKKINELIRDNLVKNKDNFISSKDEILREKTIEILKKLPIDKSKWSYGYNSLNNVKPLINGLTKYYIENYHKDDYRELIKRLNIEEIELKKLYGKGKDGKEEDKYKDYKKNKLDDLHKRMGNSLLKELREFAKEEENNKKKYRSEEKNQYQNSKNEFKYSNKNTRADKKAYNKSDKKEKNINRDKEERINKDIKDYYKNANQKYEKSSNMNTTILFSHKSINDLKKVMKNEVEKSINKREFEKAEREKEYENEMEI